MPSALYQKQSRAIQVRRREVKKALKPTIDAHRLPKELVNAVLAFVGHEYGA